MLWWQLPEVWVSTALAAGLGLCLGLGLMWRARQRAVSVLKNSEQALQQSHFENQQALRRYEESVERLEQTEQRYEQARRQLHETETRLAAMEAQRKSDYRHYQEQLRLLNDNREHLKNEFNHLAQEIFDAKGKRFAEESQQKLTALLQPFREQVEQFRKRVDDIHHRDTEGRAELKNQLHSLRELNTQLNRQASDLTQALKGDKKLQGNWGELQVERILESAGLQRGREYEREMHFRDDTGQSRRPDFIVHLPDGKHLIIDSKVSLNDYQSAVAATDEIERETALKKHLAAVRQHIQGLSEKNYPHLPGMKAPDFVLMFMPIEPAFTAALEADPGLFEIGFSRNVILVTPTTLLATLRTVSNLWTLERQNENAKQVFDQAGKVLEKFSIFAEKMDRLGNQIGTAQRTYDEAWKSLSDGRGSLARQVEKLQELGAPVRRKIPESVSTGLAGQGVQKQRETDS